MVDVLLALHVLAATVWVGGTVALVFVAVPVARRFEGEARATALRELGRRWRPLGWSALGVLLVTGVPLIEEAGWRPLLAVKLACVAAIGILAYLHDFVLGPGLARQIRAGVPQTLRPPLTVIGRITLVLTLVVPVLGVVIAGD